MKASDFINLFKTGRLGKKRQHAGYKVMDGDHCQLLVRATRQYGVPGGSELIGIYFGDGLCIFHSNFNMLRDSVSDHVTHPKPVFTNVILKGDDPNILDSGIIGFDDTKRLLLLEIGETPWLLEYDPKYTPSKWSDWEWSYNTGTQISKRVETVEAAEKDIVLPDDQISTIGRLLKVLPSDFVPLSTSKEDEKLLMAPPNPFDFGLGLDDLCVQSVYARGGRGCTPLYVKEKVISSPRGAPFKQAAYDFNAATKRFDEREPSQWEELTSGDNGVILIGANEQVYVKGHVYHRYNAAEKADFATWHQVLGTTPKVRLPVR
jgi:hypothetical protein